VKAKWFVPLVVFALILGIAYGIAWTLIEEIWLKSIDWWMSRILFVAIFVVTYTLVFYHIMTRRISRSRIWDEKR